MRCPEAGVKRIAAGLGCDARDAGRPLARLGVTVITNPPDRAEPFRPLIYAGMRTVTHSASRGRYPYRSLSPDTIAGT